MNRTFAVLAFVSGLASSGAAFAEWGEPHLDIVPRTEAEQARIDAVMKPTTDFSAPEKFETHPAGAATKFGIATRDAFSFVSANVPFERELNFKVGNGFFKKLWVSSPSSTTSSDGLGPLYNARACQRCHIKDGRGHPPENAEDTGVSMFLRIAVPKWESDLDAEILKYMANAPDPNYGNQLQDKSLPGIPAEGRMVITYSPVEVELADGTVVELRKPTYDFVDLGYGPLHPKAELSPRVTPQMIGLGLLEAIPEQDIFNLIDPNDVDGDGISGRANRVWSAEHQQWMLGRFGHKAGMPSIKEQSAAAFAGDIGISTSLHPNPWGECMDTQTACVKAPHGDNPKDNNLEAADEVLDLVTFYSRNLAVPTRRNLDDPQVLRGKQIFYEANCTGCHTPKFVTHRLKDQPEQSFQLIWPYTDMLLHYMGEGLADGREEYADFNEWDAMAGEWRTPPLWGIGMTETVSGHTYFLHDGRARNLLEAVLWHGGEAQNARDAVVALGKEDRDALIAFLESL